MSRQRLNFEGGAYGAAGPDFDEYLSKSNDK